MKDTIIKGTGNSRYLKSAIPENITHQQLVDLLRNGAFPVDLNGVNMDGIEQLGTPLNTATMLQQATAALLGLKQADPTVDDAFEKISDDFKLTPYLSGVQGVGVADFSNLSLKGPVYSKAVSNSQGTIIVLERNGSSLYPQRSTDGGVSFTQGTMLSSNARDALLVLAEDTFVAIFFDDTHDHIVSMSSVDGVTWGEQVYINSMGYPIRAEVDGSEIMLLSYYNSTLYFGRSLDKGATWDSWQSVVGTYSNSYNKPDFGYVNVGKISSTTYWVRFTTNREESSICISTDLVVNGFQTISSPKNLKFMITYGGATYGCRFSGEWYYNTSPTLYDTEWQKLDTNWPFCPTDYSIDGEGNLFIVSQFGVALTSDIREWIVAGTSELNKGVLGPFCSKDTPGSFLINNSQAIVKVSAIRKDNNVLKELTDSYGNSYPCIETGSYIGTGLSGFTTPNKIVSSIYPEVVIVGGANYASSQYPSSLILVRPSSSAYNQNCVSWQMDSVTWWTVSSDTTAWAYQLNILGQEYSYIILGRSLIGG